MLVEDNAGVILKREYDRIADPGQGQCHNIESNVPLSSSLEKGTWYFPYRRV